MQLTPILLLIETIVLLVAIVLHELGYKKLANLMLPLALVVLVAAVISLANYHYATQ